MSASPAEGCTLTAKNGHTRSTSSPLHTPPATPHASACVALSAGGGAAFFFGRGPRDGSPLTAFSPSSAACRSVPFGTAALGFDGTGSATSSFSFTGSCQAVQMRLLTGCRRVRQACRVRKRPAHGGP